MCGKRIVRKGMRTRIAIRVEIGSAVNAIAFCFRRSSGADPTNHRRCLIKYTAHQHCRVVSSLTPQSVNAGAATGTTGVDCKGYREALVILHVGAATGSIASAILQESSDNAVADAYAAVTDNAAVTQEFTAVDSTNDVTVFVGRVDLTRVERYLRVLYDVDTNAVIFGVLFCLCDPVDHPATQVETVAFDHLP